MATIIEVTDLSMPELEPFTRLTEAQLRNRLEPEKGIFIAESPKVILRALDAGYEPVSLLMEHRQLTGQGSGVLARCAGIPVYTASRELLAELTGYPLTRGVLCAMRRPKLPSVEELCAGGHRGLHQHRRDLPLRGGAEHGRGAGDAHLQRSTLPQGGAGEYGNHLPGPVDPDRGGAVPMAGCGTPAPAEPGIPDCCHGAER